LSFLFPERRVVDNQVFLLGLDKFYRDAMKGHERGELLLCARRVAAQLATAPANVPVEGYYAEEQELTEYFRLMRALQDVPGRRIPEVAALTDYQRLRDVASAPLFGRVEDTGKLLPAGRDPLCEALWITGPEWTVARLLPAAQSAALKWDDFSLVGLAARIQNPVVLTALRESVVLYAAIAPTASPIPPRYKYVWQVDKEIATQAERFIKVFQQLFGEELPPPKSSQAERYWHAAADNEIRGRCVRLGYDDRQQPVRYYHWALCLGEDRELTVHEFWHTEVWTTTRYRENVYGSEAAESGKDTIRQPALFRQRFQLAIDI